MSIVSKNFGYCVWLVFDNEWNMFVDGFDAHMTVKSCMDDLDKAYALFARVIADLRVISKNGYNKFEIELSGNCVTSCEKDFNALVYMIECHNIDGGIRKWWPTNAHLSVCYKYNNMDSNLDAENIFSNDVMKNKDMLLNSGKIIRKNKVEAVRIMKCDGHYKNWKIIEEIKL